MRIPFGQVELRQVDGAGCAKVDAGKEPSNSIDRGRAESAVRVVKKHHGHQHTWPAWIFRLTYAGTMTAMSIRRAGVDDAETLVALSTDTFTETFGHLYAPEDLETFLDSAYDLDKHKKLLADPDYGVWLLEDGDDSVGYVLAGPCGLPHDDVQPDDQEIKRLYVRSTHQSSGYGAHLMDTALNWIGDKTVWLGVWSENYGAQRFYERYGFGEVGEYFFEVGEHRDQEYIFKRPK